MYLIRRERGRRGRERRRREKEGRKRKGGEGEKKEREERGEDVGIIFFLEFITINYYFFLENEEIEFPFSVFVGISNLFFSWKMKNIEFSVLL